MWVALFSNSGSELGSLCRKLETKPDIILCDKIRGEWDSNIANITQLQEHKDIVNLLASYPEDTLITLHGYLRLIPHYAIKENMYNVHPGDIIKYPQLKGIHPQAKALELNLPSTGVVIHKLTSEVDSGEIVSFASYNMKENETKLSLINNLRDISINLWYEFLRGKV